MLYRIKLQGHKPGMLQHAIEISLDKKHPWTVEKTAIAKKRGTNRSEQDESDLQRLECQSSIWWKKVNSSVILPQVDPLALRACIETAARKVKQGPLVRGGLIVEQNTQFTYKFDDVNWDELVQRQWDDPKGGLQHQAPVRVQRNAILRTRALFQDWTATFNVYADPEMIDEGMIRQWLKVAGRTIGIGDWRPATSGIFGRFELAELEQIDE